MRPREGRLKITNREGMAARQGRDEMKACMHSSRAAIEAELYNSLGWANRLYWFVLFFWQNKGSNENIILTVKPIRKNIKKNVQQTLIHLLIHSTNYAIYDFSQFIFYNIIVSDGHMNGIFIKQPGLISNLSLWGGSKTMTALWMSLLVVKILPRRVFCQLKWCQK